GDTPMISYRSGMSPAVARWNSPGSSLRWARSPVAPNTTMTWLPGRGTNPAAGRARKAAAAADCSRAGVVPEPAAPGAMVVDMADAPFSGRARQPRLVTSAGEVAIRYRDFDVGGGALPRR